MTLVLQVALQQPLFIPLTQFTRTNASTKILPGFFTPFAPQLFQVTTSHIFLATYANVSITAPPPQTSFYLMSKTSVKAACDSQLIQWIASCLQNIGRPRPINVLRDSAGIPRVLLQNNHNQVHLPVIRVDFAFIHGHAIEDERVAAVLQTKAVGSLDPFFWGGYFDGTTVDRRMTQEARA